ncbi:MAG: hypothetical protein IT383_06095 [Deltaproteobacteria bacterium]|nr:hypothetical protein [Deltaproteobacteria bacterium]
MLQALRHVGGRHGAAFALVVALVAAAPASAVGRPHEPRVHPADVRNAQLLAVAEARMREGKAAPALEALWSIDDSRARLDRFTRARLLGLASFALGRFEETSAALDEAGRIAVGRGSSLRGELWIVRARAEHALGRCAPALAALTRAGPARVRDVDAVLVQASCENEGGLRAAAIDTLSTGLLTIDDPRLRVMRAHRLLELGARAAAQGDARAALPRAGVDELLVLASAFVERSAVAEATEILRVLRRRFPDDVRAHVALSRLSTGREAAQAAVEAARLDPRHAADATELLRRDNALGAALRESAGIGDERARLRARLAALVDARAWDRALALRQALDSAGLGADDAVRYALAYAAFSVGDDPHASALLDGIVDATLFERASRLRVAIAACAEAEAPCAR